MNAFRSILHVPGRIAAKTLITLVRAYQFTLSPLIGPACRFEPSCSNYMIESINKYGTARGLFKGVGRVCRCHPWGGSGYDPP
jgi:putative membrane protein insertion efficiency factor